MLTRLLPQRVENSFRGHPLAIWLFAPVVILKTGIALTTLFNGRVAAQTADGLPLDTYGAGGAEAVVALFAIWGLSQLMASVFGFLALVRYRALIPFMFTLLLLEQLARKVVLMVKPIARTGTPPGVVVNFVLLGLMIVGLVLSLISRPGPPQQP